MPDDLPQTVVPPQDKPRRAFLSRAKICRPVGHRQQLQLVDSLARRRIDEALASLGDELLTIEQIGFGFVIAIIDRRAPAHFDRNRRHVQMPTLSEGSITRLGNVAYGNRRTKVAARSGEFDRVRNLGIPHRVSLRLFHHGDAGQRISFLQFRQRSTIEGDRRLAGSLNLLQDARNVASRLIVQGCNGRLFSISAKD